MKSIEEVAARLETGNAKRAKEQHESGKAAGLFAGREWIEADEDFLAVENAEDPVTDLRVFWESHYEGDDLTAFEDDDYADGWIEGVLAVWNEVKAFRDKRDAS